MNIEDIRDYCLEKKGASECMPFGDGALVFKVLDKMFALASLDGPLTIILKCDPERAVELREHYPAIAPGYHMNKKYWNMVYIDNTLPTGLITGMIDHSYIEVVKKLTTKQKQQLARP